MDGILNLLMDKDGVIILPVTSAGGVLLEDGTTSVEDKLTDLTNNNQIKGFAVKTRLEYDALTEAEKNNGIAYIIKE
jgi:hypothetical protein